MSIINTRWLEKALIDRGMVPDNCRLIEVIIAPNSAPVIRYEVFIQSDHLGLFADAIKAAADEAMADDERARLRRSVSLPEQEIGEAQAS